MANWANPTLTSTYINFVAEVKDRDLDAAYMFDPAVVTPTGLSNNTIRWTSASSKWQKQVLGVWEDLTATYAINVSTLGGVAAAGYLKINPGADQTITSGKLTLDINSATPLDLKGGTADNVMIQLYPDAANPTTVRAKIGYIVTTAIDLSITNSYPGGDITLVPDSSGEIRLNTKVMVPIDARLNFRDTSSYIYSTASGSMSIITSNLNLSKVQISANNRIYFNNTNVYIYSPTTDGLYVYGTGYLTLATAGSVALSGGTGVSITATTNYITLTSRTKVDAGLYLDGKTVRDIDIQGYGQLWYLTPAAAADRLMWTSPSGIDRTVVLTSPVVNANYYRAGNMFLYRPANAAHFDVYQAMLAGQHETLGPTNSGADNIWSVLDDAPPSTTAFIFVVYLAAAPVSTALETTISFYGTDASSTISSFTDHIRASHTSHRDTTSGAFSTAATQHMIVIPCTTGQTMKVGWSAGSLTAGQICRLFFRGYYIDY